MKKPTLSSSSRKINTKGKIATASRLLHVFVTSGKQLILTVLCGVLLTGTLLAQESEAIQPPQEPQPKQIDSLTHLRQGQPGVYQSFQPCRLVDTRNSNGPFGGPKLSAGGTRSFSLVPSGGACGDTLPAGATALAINVTITGTESGGFLTVWPTGQPQPNASVVNWTGPGTTVANAIIVPVGYGGSIDIFSSEATHVILDVSGYYLNSLETGDQLAIVANNETAAVVGQNTGDGAGIRGESAGGPAGQFAGNVEVAGNVTLSGAGNGIVFPDGTTQTTAGGGGGGVGGTGTANAVPLWTNGTTLGNSVITQAGGNVGVGTTTPASKLDVRGSLVLDHGNPGPAIYTSSSGGEQNRYLHLINSPTLTSASGLKAGGILVSDSFAFANPGKNDLIVKGNVGIGTASLGAKLSISGFAGNFTPFNGLSIDQNYHLFPADGYTFRVRSINQQTLPATTFTNFLINSYGDVGIGTATPNHRLRIVGGPTWTSHGWTGAMELDSASAIAWRANAAGRRFGIGQSGGGLYFFHTNSDPGTTGSPAVHDLIIRDNGNVSVKVLEIQGGADFAENFDISGATAAGTAASSAAIAPGMVVAIDALNPGKLIISGQAYNRRVAGIISGAGGVKPGMVMGQEGSIANGKHPVALTGRVYVRADATCGAIKPGDLLTTSTTPGHAMRVTNHSRAQGAIIGKAMTGLKSGKGLVLVLVTLQ